MSPSHPRGAAINTGFPRVSGDEPQGIEAPLDLFGFSPRERG